MIHVLALILILLPGMALAQTSAADRARSATEMLDSAVAQLESAGSARDRVRALTATVSAFEEGLLALRSGLRQADLRERELSAKLQDRNEETAALLSVLMVNGAIDSPVLLLHPGGPAGSVRAGLMLSDLAPSLNARASDLRRDLEELQQVQALQQTASERLEEGLAEVQMARADLNDAIANRTDLPKRFANDPVREAILIASADTLESFASGLDQIRDATDSIAPETLAGQKGALPLPVQGQIIRQSGETDAAGVTRPGIVLGTQSRALVTSPVSASLRYIGPLLDLGEVVILEPQAKVLFVFAGLDTVFGAAGDIVNAGDPLGLMGGEERKNAAELSTDGDETGTSGPERLYIEVRENNTPEDPNLWFLIEKNG